MLDKVRLWIYLVAHKENIMDIRKQVRIPEELDEEIQEILEDIKRRYPWLEKYEESKFYRWCFNLGIREYKKNGLEAL